VSKNIFTNKSRKIINRISTAWYGKKSYGSRQTEENPFAQDKEAAGDQAADAGGQSGQEETSVICRNLFETRNSSRKNAAWAFRLTYLF